MPETAVNEDDLATAGEDQIGLAGKFRAVKAEAIAELVSDGSNAQLGG
jgi:hypothetical protein